MLEDLPDTISKSLNASSDLHYAIC